MNLKQAKELVRGRLSDKRYEHTINVKKMAVKLAKRYGADEEKAALAAILHDSAKEISKDEMREIMRQYPSTPRAASRFISYCSTAIWAQARPRSHAASSKRCPEENAEVSSPSFTLCNSYPTTPPSSIVICTARRRIAR